jgi:uncharacterized protein YdiU (UPF0061 family)
MSILGLTLDYGPYGFLDDYDPGFICNHTDTGGRYAFDQQPAVGMWNCARLGEAFMGLAPALAPERWQEELEGYWPEFGAAYRSLMLGKLGLNSGTTDFTDHTDEENDRGLITDLLGLLQAERADYTVFFRGLCDYSVNSQQSTVNSRDSEAMRAWLARYSARLRAEGSVDAERRERMRQVNPKYVLRNWIAQEAIAEAEARRYESIEQLRRLFADPYAEHTGMERFAEPPSAEAREIAVSCSS